jgi:hypothetical protein
VSKVKCCKIVGRRVIGKEIKGLVFDLDLDLPQEELSRALSRGILFVSFKKYDELPKEREKSQNDDGTQNSHISSSMRFVALKKTLWTLKILALFLKKDSKKLKKTSKNK